MSYRLQNCKCFYFTWKLGIFREI